VCKKASSGREIISLPRKKISLVSAIPKDYTLTFLHFLKSLLYQPPLS
jgi:hypothetical protein